MDKNKYLPITELELPSGLESLKVKTLTKITKKSKQLEFDL